MKLRNLSDIQSGNETLDSRKPLLSKAESRRPSPGISSPNFYSKFLGKLNLLSDLRNEGSISFNAALALSARSCQKVRPKKLPRIAYYCQSSRYNRLNAGICMQELTFREQDLPRVPNRLQLRRYKTITPTRPRRRISGVEPVQLNAVGTPILGQAERPVRRLD